MKASFGILAAVIMFLSADVLQAEIVPLKFSQCGMVVNSKGNYLDSPASSRFIFSNIALGADCGSAQAAYLRGETTNNFLDKGLLCTVKAVLKSRKGRVIRSRKLVVKNELGTVRASSKTDGKGRVSMSFRTLDAGPDAYTLFGPKIAPGQWIACRIYSYDHMV